MAKTHTNGRSARVLYITYDGLTDPLGRSQVLPYLTGLAARGHRISILSCEKSARMDKDGERIRKLCVDAGLDWHPLKYHKRPPILSSVLDAALLNGAAVKLHRKEPFDLVHCRSYIPARAGLALKRRFGVRLLFDMRGFWPDERVEGGSWNLRYPLYRAIYRYFKRLESRLLRASDHIISLTEAGRKVLIDRPELADRGDTVTVIPCCVDFDHFPLAAPLRARARSSLGLPADAKVLAYVGSIGTWYMLDEMLEFFRAYGARYSSARFLFITPDLPELVEQAARRLAIDPKRLAIRSASREQVPEFLAAADAGISFIKPVYSKIASSPTKLGEMLAMGIPVVANTGVGDVEEVLAVTHGGVAVRDFDHRSYSAAVDRLDDFEVAPETVRARALRIFDLVSGIGRYDSIYRALAGNSPVGTVTGVS